MRHGFKTVELRRVSLRTGLFYVKHHGFALLFLTAAMVTSNCSRTSQAAAATVVEKHAAPQPPHIGPNTITFRLVNGSVPVSGAMVQLEGDMTHAGMAPVFGSAKEISPGQYQGELTLTMQGDWVVLMHITLPDGRKVEDQMNVNGVQAK